MNGYNNYNVVKNCGGYTTEYSILYVLFIEKYSISEYQFYYERKGVFEWWSKVIQFKVNGD